MILIHQTHQIQMTTIQLKIAYQFCKKINEVLSSDQIEKVNQLNQSPEYGGCDALHEVCTPNSYILAAYCQVMNVENVIMDDEFADIVYTAWDFAKDNKFNVNEIGAYL